MAADVDDSNSESESCSDSSAGVSNKSEQGHMADSLLCSRRVKNFELIIEEKRMKQVKDHSAKEI